MAATPESWTIKDLRVHLQAALELELLVIPPYLSALYSLHPETNREAEMIVRSVVVEEMLHMTLAANLLNAVGGEPTVTDPRWLPRYPAKLPFGKGSFAVSLRPFGTPALDAFLTIENPSYTTREPEAAPADAAVPRMLTLDNGEGEPYGSVGAFYHAIEAGLKSLVERLGEGEVFSGDAALQVGPEYYYAAGGTSLVITNLASALQALEEIVEQGEGKLTKPPSGGKFDVSEDLAHFYRFNELRQGRRYLVGDEPREATGAKVDIDLAAVYPMKVDLRLKEIPAGELHDAAEACCEVWSRLLDQIEDGISGNAPALRDAVVTMFDLKYSAQRLLRVPLPGDAGAHAGPTFEYLQAKPREEQT